MKSLFYAATALVWACNIQAQSSTTTSTVPSGTPIPGYYGGPLRPQVHFSPPQNFMNDPNGLHLDAQGTYHLYYQYDPTSTAPGNQHWGHATSKDLYHWENQAIALAMNNDTSFAYSGSAVIDVNNTSGFFPDQDNGVVAIFTIATTEPVNTQSQGLAFSRDGGYNFTLYDGNPILDFGTDSFRDPQVTWHNDHWVMVVAFSGDFVVAFYTSTDLKNWTHASNTSHVGLLGQQYECPNLFEVPVEGTDEMLYILQISINPGAPLGGSISQGIVGNFDGYKFTPVDGAARINDFGKDNYAGQVFYGLPAGSKAIAMDWASNWEYTGVVPTGELEGWRSALGLPRERSLRRISGVDWALISTPVDMTPVCGQLLAKQSLGNGTFGIDFSTVSSNAVYFEANITESVSAGFFNFTFSSPVSGEYLQGGIELGAMQPVWINRGGIRGFDNPYFTDKFSASTYNGITHVMGVIDRSIFELFVNYGQNSATNVFYPLEPLTQLNMGTSGIMPNNVTVDIEVYALQSAWTQYEDDSGMVLGNITTSGSANMLKRSHERVLYHPEF